MTKAITIDVERVELLPCKLRMPTGKILASFYF